MEKLLWRLSQLSAELKEQEQEALSNSNVSSFYSADEREAQANVLGDIAEMVDSILREFAQTS